MKTTVLNWFETNYSDLIQSMRECTHTHSNGSKNPFHMEGDVWTHTKMVFESLESDDINHYFAALLHDIGKIDSRKETVKGFVSFRGHENISMVKSIDILKAAKKEFDIDILLTLQLIAWHGQLWKKKDGGRDSQFKKINNKFAFKDGFYESFLSFVKADALGRTTLDEDDELKVMEEFEFLENYIPFNGAEFNKHKPYLEVICLVGISGSGKSTWMRDNAHISGYEVISVDKFLEKGKLSYNNVDYDKNIKKAHDQSLVDIENAVNNEVSVIIDMTNLTEEARAKKLSDFPSTKYRLKGVVFLSGLDQISKNLKKRSEKKIPAEVIARQVESFELPGMDEFHEIEYIL